jgi:hypothetical protein
LPSYDLLGQVSGTDRAGSGSKLVYEEPVQFFPVEVPRGDMPSR